MSIAEEATQVEILTVSQLNAEVQCLLEDNFATVWVEGEISNFAAPGSGHWYFGLKDKVAQVRCAMFRGQQRKLSFVPKDGMHILIRARASLYPARGEYQLIVDYMEERGEGVLRREYELLKKKLEALGLFDTAKKKPIPLFPKKIGVITSDTGAAIRDILSVFKRRYACVPVVIYPSLVQGKTAAATIVRAIQVANMRNECDVLIVSRGGGSLEDLWCFNEEIVAHAIFASAIPIISGVGHEVDFTIADFVADVRAPTPSVAAEMASPDCQELLQKILRYQQQVKRNVLQKLAENKKHLVWMQKHLLQQHPKRQLQDKMQRLDFTEMKLKNIINTIIEKYRSKLGNVAAKLDALSPLSTLQRGFAIVMDEQQQIVRSVTQVKSADNINVRLSDGTIKCEVTGSLQ